MKKIWKVLLIVLVSLAVLLAVFLVFVNTGNEERNLAGLPAGLENLSPRAVRLEGVPVAAQPDGFTCGVTTAAITASFVSGAEVTPQSLIGKYSLGSGMKSEEFEALLASELPAYSVLYTGGVDDTTLLATIYGQLAEGFPVPVFFGAPNPYNKPWYDFHASVVTGLDLDSLTVDIVNAYGYAEQLTVGEFLDRMSYRGGSKYPFVQRAVLRLGLMERNALVLISKNKK